MTYTHLKQWSLMTVLILSILMAAAAVSALDAPYARKGPFAGFGMGGGLALTGGGDPYTALGDIGLHLQAGVGANESVTIAFNLDMRLGIGNTTTMGLFDLGPELVFFVTRGLFLQMGIGLAIASSDTIDGRAVGIQAAAGIGYEFWVNTNWAAFMRFGADYSLLNGASDVVSFGFFAGLKYY